MDNKKPIEAEDDTRKLMLAVIYMSLIVGVLFGFGPSV